jgi:hypothetical protein
LYLILAKLMDLTLSATSFKIANLYLDIRSVRKYVLYLHYQGLQNLISDCQFSKLFSYTCSIQKNTFPF